MEGPRRSKRESARKRKAEGEEPKIKEEKQPAKRRRLSAAAPVPPAKPTGPSRSVPADQPTSSLAKASRTTQTKPAKTSPPKRARSPSPEEDDVRFLQPPALINFSNFVITTCSMFRLHSPSKI